MDFSNNFSPALGILGGFINQGNPADAGMDYLKQIPDVLKQYLSPYMDAGHTSLDKLMGQYGNLVDDPSAVMNKIGGSYQQSPGYQFQYNQGMNATNSAAASGGMLGTPYHQQMANSMSQNVANQDYYNYMNHALGLYGQGLSGYQGINQMGYNASDSMAQGMSANLMNQANMAYLGQANQNKSNADRFNSVIGGIGGIASSFF